MPRLPDRFDLWVRRARASADPERQADYVLGALVGLDHWYFLNGGTPDQPEAATAPLEGVPHLLVFSDAGRVEELAPDQRPAPVMAIPSPVALPWALQQESRGVAGLLVNPGEDAFVVSLAHVRDYHTAWTARGARLTAGFWIPNLTSEEEDFWQEHGL